MRPLRLCGYLFPPRPGLTEIQSFTVGLSFTGLDPNGTWTLTITGVPEPGAVLLAFVSAALILRRRLPS